jgi:putative transposase
LLPVPYFHEVFTLSHCLNPFFLRDPSAAHALLFEAAARTLIDVCRTNLGATPGLIALLHTWNQQLEHHSHIHCITTGGGLSLDRTRWISSRPTYFLPVLRLSEVFRGKLLQAFELALKEGRLRTSEAMGRLLLRRAAAQDFVVYSKPPIAPTLDARFGAGENGVWRTPTLIWILYPPKSSWNFWTGCGSASGEIRTFFR